MIIKKCKTYSKYLCNDYQKIVKHTTEIYAMIIEKYKKYYK